LTQALGGHVVVRVANAVEEKLELTLGVGRDAPSRARKALGGLNGSLADLRQPVRLLVSELVTNAVLHAGTGSDRTVRVRLEARSDQVRVEVSDEGPGFDPGTGDRVDPRAGGFGLTLLDELADRWGVEAEQGARVWFEIDRRSVARTAQS
jgi:anti-sigma regulatory factor (Ser/Thr protein kinase)